MADRKKPERQERTLRGTRDDREEMIVPGNKRRMQRRRRLNRQLFGVRMKEDFLDALACSCNVVAAAEAVGVNTSTVYRHRRIDPEFRDLWWQALEQGAAKLVALRIQREVERAEAVQTGAAGAGALQPDMDGPPDSRQIADLFKLIGLLREHAQALGGARKAGAPPHKVSIEAVSEKLIRKLRGLGVSPEGGGSGALPAAGEGSGLTS